MHGKVGDQAMSDEEPADILIIEDDAVQRESIIRILQTTMGEMKIAAFSGGGEALDYLFGNGAYANRISNFPPRLVFLDMRLAGESGLEVLARIRAYEGNESIARIPVVVFTDSHLVDDINNSYKAGANSFVRKPFVYTEFQSTIRDVAQYWLTLNFPAEYAG
jgi:two-component system response regulator